MKAILLSTCLAVSLATVGFQTSTINKLKSEVTYRRVLSLSMAPGATIPSVDLPLLAGGSIDLSTGNKDSLRLVFVLTTTCPKCKAVLPEWKALVDSVSNATILNPVALAASPKPDVMDWAKSNSISFPVAIVESGRVASQLRAALVPQVAVLNHKGVVVYSAVGVVGQDSILRVLRRLDSLAQIGRQRR